MTPEALAAVHAACFGDTPPPWPATAFAALLADPLVLLAARPEGFALGRRTGPEAELLTLAVLPAARRCGLGRTLVRAFETAAAGAEEAFLEVAATNLPARALYASLGYAEVGRRRGYYAPAIDALVLRKALEFN